MVKVYVIGICLGGVLTLCPLVSSAMPVPVRSQVGLEASVNFYEVGVMDLDWQEQGQSDSLAALGVEALAHQTYAGAEGTAAGHVDASWAGVAAGAVHAEMSIDYHDETMLERCTVLARGACVPERAVWVYAFVADTDGAFRVAYSTSRIGGSPYVETFWFVFNSSLGEQRHGISDDTAGSFAFAFLAGDTCMVRLSTYLSLSGTCPEYYEWRAISFSWDFDTATSGVTPLETADPDLVPHLSVVPSPFTQCTEIRLLGNVSSEGPVRVFDASGRLVRTLENAPAGNPLTTLSWDGTSDDGSPVAPSVYYVVARTPGGTESCPVVFAR